MKLPPSGSLRFEKMIRENGGAPPFGARLPRSTGTIADLDLFQKAGDAIL
jgi:hypothetical protein